MKFYDGSKLLSEKASFYITIGGRGNGKTYFYLDKAIKRYKDGLGRFMLIRRTTQSTTSTQAAQMFTDINNIIVDLYGQGYYIRVRSGQIFLSNIDNKKTTEDEKIGYIVALADAGKIKGNNYNDVTMTLNDEMLPMQDENYVEIGNDCNKYMSIISTVCRHRNNVLNCLTGNTERTDSTYFKAWGINPLQLKQGKIHDIYCRFRGERGMRIRLEYSTPLRDDEGKTVVPDYLKFDGRQSEMAIAGTWNINEQNDKYNGRTLQEHVTFKDYTESGVTISIENETNYITISQKENNPILLTDKPVAKQKLHLKKLAQIRYYPNLLRVFGYKIAGRQILGDMFKVDWLDTQLKGL